MQAQAYNKTVESDHCQKRSDEQWSIWRKEQVVCLEKSLKQIPYIFVYKPIRVQALYTKLETPKKADVKKY